MNNLPSYLNIGSETRYAPRTSGGTEDYQPLLAIWLIDLSLSLGWLDNPPRAGLEGVFGSSEFVDITALRDLERLFEGHLPDDDLDELLGEDEATEEAHARQGANCA